MAHPPQTPVGADASATDPTTIGSLGAREMVVLMAMLMALNALAIDTMLPALPAMAADLRAASANAQQFVVSAYLLGVGLGSIVHGPLADRFGRRRVLLCALVAYVVAAVGSATAQDFNQLLAWRLVHGMIGAALGVVVVAVIRDLFSGDAMARRMSLIFLIFMVVPILAPSLGAAILTVAPWRAIYGVLAVLGAVMAVWAFLRLPETLEPGMEQRLEPAVLLSNWRSVILNRSATSYMFASAVVQGALYGYLNSAQQIIAGVFDAPDRFPLVFACIGVGIAVSNFFNAAIVERFGARRVSQTALFAFLIFATLQVIASLSGVETLVVFTLLLTVNVGLVGFIGANFGAVAMEPFAAFAGAASSFQSFAKMITSAVLGALIGQMFDMTTLPLALSFVASALVALALVLVAERGKLLTRPRTAPRPTDPARRA